MYFYHPNGMFNKIDSIEEIFRYANYKPINNSNNTSDVLFEETKYDQSPIYSQLTNYDNINENFSDLEVNKSKDNYQKNFQTFNAHFEKIKLNPNQKVNIEEEMLKQNQMVTNVKNDPYKLIDTNSITNFNNGNGLMKRNLIFSSVGDNTTFHNNWIGNNKNYDLFICYYGDSNDKFKEYSDYYIMHKGSKFQNLHYVYQNYKSVLDKYSYFFIPDDDIIISVAQINKLFDIIKVMDLWIIQPSFNIDSKISHRITLSNPKYKLRYVNFIEVGVPLFSKYALFKILNNYPTLLTCYGVDYFYIWLLGYDKLKYAIIDEITCINPDNPVREIDKLISSQDREKNWEIIKKKYKINEWQHKTLRYQEN